MCLQVFGLEAGVLCDAGQHLPPDLILIMEREHEVGPAGCSRIDITAMPDVQDYDLLRGIVYFVDDWVITRTNAPAVAANQLLAARRPRLIRQRRDGVTYTSVISFRQVG
jgi:hypothetical protein